MWSLELVMFQLSLDTNSLATVKGEQSKQYLNPIL